MIKILSRSEAVELLESDPYYPIIIIGETYDEDYKRLTSIAKHFLLLLFDDITKEIEGYVTCKKEQVELAVEWSKDKKDLAVACFAGISRSSAIAYVIESRRTSPEKAFEILIPDFHMPNQLVLDLGKPS